MGFRQRKMKRVRELMDYRASRIESKVQQIQKLQKEINVLREKNVNLRYDTLNSIYLEQKEKEND